MSAVKPGSALGAALRGTALAAGTAPALALSFAITAAAASVAAAPAAASLHAALDRLPGAASLAGTRDVPFFFHLGLARPALAGDDPFGRDAFPASALRQEGALGSLLVLAIANTALASVFAGGLAARFASEKGRASLPAFASDAVRFAPASLLLGALSLSLVLGLFHLLVTLPGRLLSQASPRYEWESVLPRLLLGALFVLAAVLVRSTTLAARGAMGLSASTNPLSALGTGLGVVVRRPGAALLLESVFALAALLPAALWFTLGPSLPGWQGRLLDLLGQQGVLFLALAARAAHLGALQSLVRGGGPHRAKGAPSAAPEGA